MAGAAGEAGESSGHEGGAGGTSGANPSWAFCQPPDPYPDTSGDVTIVLDSTRWCARNYVLTAVEFENGTGDPLAKSLRRRAQVRAVEGAYPAESVGGPLLIPWCIRTRSAVGVATALGESAPGTSWPLGHEQPVTPGEEAVVVLADFSEASESSELEVGRVRFSFSDAYLETSNCDETGVDLYRVRTYAFDGGSLTMETGVLKRETGTTLEVEEERWIVANGRVGETSFRQSSYYAFAATQGSALGGMLGLGVVLDEPIDEVCGFRMRPGVPGLFATDCELGEIAELDVSEATTEEHAP